MERIKRKRWYDAQMKEHRIFKEGDFVLIMNRPVTLQLQSPYSPAVYRVVENKGDDTYKVEQLATKATTRAHASHMRIYDMTRSSLGEEIARAWGQARGEIESINRTTMDPDSEVTWFSVTWVGHDKPTWQTAKDLKGTEKFREYCDRYHLSITALVKKVNQALTN